MLSIAADGSCDDARGQNGSGFLIPVTALHATVFLGF